MEYTIGLLSGGLMGGDPSWRVSEIYTIEAKSLIEAKDKWAKITGNDQRSTWNKETRTVYGWSLVETTHDMEGQIVNQEDFE